MTVTAVIKRHNIAVQLADQSGRLCDPADCCQWHHARIRHLPRCREAQLIIVATAQCETSLPLNRKIFGQRRGNWEYEEIGLAAGLAYNSQGQSMGAMGIACADFDGNGLLDLMTTNFINSATDFVGHASSTLTCLNV